MNLPTIQIKKILYATDLSESAVHAFAYAVSLANLYGAGISILHVLAEYPGEEFIYNIQEETYEAQYRAENNFMKSFMLAALLALITSSLGLLAFARYNTMKRTREIGIRKTFGSDRANILKLLHKESFVLVLAASVIGTSVSWLIVNRWLMNFPYRIDPAWWMFLSSVLITLMIAMATTFIQTSKASNMNPVDALRYE